jgi:hypothetical protein
MTSVNRISSSLSRRAGLLALTGAFAAMLGVFGGCNTGPKGPVTVPLEFRPNHADPITGTIPAVDVKVHLAPVNDKRDNKDQIGQNVEDATPVPVYAGAEKPPTQFVQDVLETELKKFGIELTDAADAADRVITLDLTRFWCEEGGQYKAEASGVAQVKDKGGRSLWRGNVAGDGTNYGNSLKPVNYTEALSDATRRLVQSLLTNPGFQQALTR